MNVFYKPILKTRIIFGRIVRNRATEKAKADMVVGTSPTQTVGGSAMTQPQQIHPTPVITPASTAGYTIHTLLGINQPVALTDVAQKRKREEGEYNFIIKSLKIWQEFKSRSSCVHIDSSNTVQRQISVKGICIKF